MINEKNDYGHATGLLQERLVLAQEVRDTERALEALCNLGYAALMQGDYERVTTLCGEALTTARDARGRGHVAHPRNPNRFRTCVTAARQL
jgi:hypothetical protein